MAATVRQPVAGAPLAPAGRLPIVVAVPAAGLRADPAVTVRAADRRSVVGPEFAVHLLYAGETTRD
jgi:hypothetical protein